MATPLSQKTLDKVAIYANKHYSLKAMGFSAEMQVRIMIAEQLFQLYASNRVPMTRMPVKVIPQVADRVYRSILTNAATDPDMARLRDECNITEGKRRTYFEMSNDIRVYECFRTVWGIDTRQHDKALYKEGAYDLIEMGKSNSDARALASGLDRLSKANNDFQEEADDYANVAKTDITVVTDVQIVRPDAENVSREAEESFQKKFGGFLGKGGIQDLVQNEEGVFEVPDEEEESDIEPDFFEQVEQREFARKK